MMLNFEGSQKNFLSFPWQTLNVGCLRQEYFNPTQHPFPGTSQPFITEALQLFTLPPLTQQVKLVLQLMYVNENQMHISFIFSFVDFFNAL